jgi:hypothetical protein
MTLSVAYPLDRASLTRGWLPLSIGIAVYIALLLGGQLLLRDPDTMWQVTVGQWMLEHRAVPETDVYSFTMRGQPWISTQWLAQIMLAQSYAVAGWSGPVVLAAGAIALAFELLAGWLNQRLSPSATLIFTAMALALCMPHLLARPHALALPVMVLWVGGLVAAADRHGAPSAALLPLMALWANLHGGFLFGLAMVGPVALDAVYGAEPRARRSLALRWGGFALAALIAACCTPYGWHSLLASRKILTLGEALPLIKEWQPADFGSLGVLEICLLLAAALALKRGVSLPLPRVLLLLGLLHMALAQVRAAELLALLAPLVLATPLVPYVGGSAPADADARGPMFGLPRPGVPIRGMLLAGLTAVLAAATLAVASVHRFAPDARQSPVAAVDALKQLHVTRLFNDYDFGGYLIVSGIAPFIDGRTELYGEKFFVDHDSASGLKEPDNLFRLLAEYDIEATLLRSQSAATKLLDHVNGWQKVYADDIATIHLRKRGAVHSAEPAVDESRSSSR